MLYAHVNLSLKVKQDTGKIFASNVISKCYLIYKEKCTKDISRTIHRRRKASDQ